MNVLAGRCSMRTDRIRFDSPRPGASRRFCKRRASMTFKRRPQRFRGSGRAPTANDIVLPVLKPAGAAGRGSSQPEAGAAGCVEEVWKQARSVAVPFRPMLDRVPAEQWPEIHAAVHQAVSRYVGDGGIAFGATVVLASGKK